MQEQLLDGGLKEAIISGLMKDQPSISPKFFYDEIGSRLFEAITCLNEYYPTRVEKQIMQQNREAIASAIGACDVLLELGAGNCEKGSALFSTLHPKVYRALDISKDFLERAVCRLQKDFPAICMQAQSCDLHQELVFPDLSAHKKVFFYPGSSIGNFDPDEAIKLFQNIVNACSGNGGLLIGVDLLKDREVLYRAYNDSLGVTAAFNKNVLLHLNRLVGTDFDPAYWSHHAIFNESLHRIEMYLRPTRSQRVRWSGGERAFAAEEVIHTENSYKYNSQEFESMLLRAGFSHVRSWTDPKHYFLVTYAAA